MRSLLLVTIGLAIAGATALTPGGAQQAPGGDPMPTPARAFALPNVPYIGNNWQEKLDGPQDFMFPSAMAAVMKYLDPKTDLGYRFYLDVSGMAYQQLWHPTRWDCAFDNIWAVHEDPVEGIRRCFEAAGYDFRVVGNTAVCHERPLIRQGLPEYAGREQLRREVCTALCSGKPVIAIGLQSGATVVAGYEQGGEVLVGWTMEDERAPADRDSHGYLRFPGWLERTEAAVLVGGKREPLPLREVCRRGLVGAVQASRRARQGEYSCGQAALTAWAEALGRDADLQVTDLKRLEAPHQAHFFISLIVAEGRAFGYDLPERAAALEPEIAADVTAAICSYGRMHDLVWRLWQTEGGGSEQDKLTRFTRPETRRELARIVLMQRDLDALAVSHLAAAAVRLGTPAAELPPPSAQEQEAVARLTQREATSGGNRTRVEHKVVNVWLTGTPQLHFMDGRECTFMGALQAALASTARPYSYGDLMGYSGLAFRTRWFDNPAHEKTDWGSSRWHPVSPDGGGAAELAALTAATGWQFRAEKLDRDPDAVSRQALITDIVLSINDGLPVVIGRNTDTACLYGYHIHSMNVFLRDYQHPQEGELRVSDRDGDFDGAVVFLQGLADEPDPRQALLAALRAAGQEARQPAAGQFRHGLDALDSWRQALADYETCSAEERELLYLVNWWTLLHLADARQAAADFLAAHADLLAGERQQALREAYALYKQEAQTLLAFCEGNRRFLVWWGGGAKPGEWTAESREAQRALLGQVRQTEEQALAALERAAR